MGCEFSTSHTVTARKSHACEHCAGQIAPGTRHLKKVGKWEGDFYACRVHEDCNQLWFALFDDWGDPFDGMPFQLDEVFLSSGEDRATQEALDFWRGHFPHAVCRIEFRLRRWLSTVAA